MAVHLRAVFVKRILNDLVHVWHITKHRSDHVIIGSTSQVLLVEWVHKPHYCRLHLSKKLRNKHTNFSRHIHVWRWRTTFQTLAPAKSIEIVSFCITFTFQKFAISHFFQENYSKMYLDSPLQFWLVDMCQRMSHYLLSFHWMLKRKIKLRHMKPWTFFITALRLNGNFGSARLILTHVTLFSAYTAIY